MAKNDQFAKALKALREQTMKMSQPEFALYLGVREAMIKDWEQAHTLPSFEKFVAVLRKLGPDADFLLKALTVQGEMGETPRPHEQLHIALEVVMQNAPRTVREKWARELEDAGNKWADRAPSPIMGIRQQAPSSNTEKVKK